ncbi:MAG: hypothetical protein KIT72_07260 [Polyangiaceae bacterium]|nr:hypothetical protein [Polyangiaceae bacterium]MCW5790201.1 hypothetical protein [Polyangiaceae bacterium]
MTRKPPADAGPSAGGGSLDDLFGSGSFEEDPWGDAGPGRAPMSSNLELGDSDPGGSTADPFATYGSGNLDFDALDESAAPLPVDALQVDTLTSDLPPPPGRAARPRGVESALRVAQARELPSPDTPRGEELPIDALVAHEVSEYGEAPSGWLTAPLYAARVFTRRLELRREQQRLAAQLTVAERRRDEALAEFALALRPAIEAERTSAALLAEVQRLEGSSGEAREATRALKQEFEQKCGVLDQADFDLQLTLGGLTEQVAGFEQAATIAREAHRRATAKLQRAQIELRSLHEVAAREQASGQLTEATAERIATFERAQVQLAPDVQTTRDELVERERPLRACLSEVAAVEKQRGALARQRRELEAAYKEQLAQRGQSTDAANAELQRALTTVGRELLRRPGTVSIGEREVAPVAERVSRVVQAAQALELMVRAEQSYDAEAVRRGVRAVGTAIALVVLLLIARVAIA